MGDPSNDFNATQALSAVHGARAQLAARLNEGSMRYDLIYSALAGLIVAGQALPSPFGALASLVCAAALALLAWDWAKRKGVWVCGVTPRRARWVALGLGVCIGVLATLVFYLTYRGESRWIALPTGLAASAVAWVGSRLWRRAFQRDLQDDFGTRRLSLGLMFGLGLLVAAGAGPAYFLHVDTVLVGYLVGVGIGMSGMAGVMMLRRRLRSGAAR